MLQKFKDYTLAKLKDKKGQGMVEYALIIGLVAIVVIAVLVLLGPAIADTFQKIVDKLKGTGTTPTTYINMFNNYL